MMRNSARVYGKLTSVYRRTIICGAGCCCFSLQLHQALREKLSSENDSVARLKDDLAAANRRHASTEDELANLRTIMHGLDNELLAKTLSLDQALRVRLVALRMYTLFT